MGRRQHQHPGRSGPVDQLQDDQGGVEGRGQPDHRRHARRGQRLVDQGHRTAAGRRRPAGRSAPVGRRPARVAPGHGAAPPGAARRYPRNDDSGPGPAPGRPLGQVTTAGEGPPPLEAARGLSRHPGGGGHVVLDHPGADPTTVELDPDPAADPMSGARAAGTE